MTEAITGFHHVTAICAAPQPNLDFHVRLLGRRLVKRAVNFDEPTVYHLYYADRLGTPGTILTSLAQRPHRRSKRTSFRIFVELTFYTLP